VTCPHPDALLTRTFVRVSSLQCGHPDSGYRAGRLAGRVDVGQAFDGEVRAEVLRRWLRPVLVVVVLGVHVLQVANTERDRSETDG
jgi:hypothetical protein